MSRVIRSLIVLVILAVAAYANLAYAETHDFYKGKTIRMVVGFTAGGAFDVYSRTIARYMGQHLPGNPTIIVENMAGAGSLVAANHIYKAANPDGLSIGNFIGGLFVGQVLGRPGIEFDALKFEYLGSPMRENTVCVTTKASGVTGIENWRNAKVPVKLGATAPGASTHDSAAVLKAALDLSFRNRLGLQGSA